MDFFVEEGKTKDSGPETKAVASSASCLVSTA